MQVVYGKSRPTTNGGLFFYRGSDRLFFARFEFAEAMWQWHCGVGDDSACSMSDDSACGVGDDSACSMSDDSACGVGDASVTQARKLLHQDTDELCR